MGDEAPDSHDGADESSPAPGANSMFGDVAPSAAAYHALLTSMMAGSNGPSGINTSGASPAPGLSSPATTAANLGFYGNSQLPFPLMAAMSGQGGPAAANALAMAHMSQMYAANMSGAAGGFPGAAAGFPAYAAMGPFLPQMGFGGPFSGIPGFDLNALAVYQQMAAMANGAAGDTDTAHASSPAASDETARSHSRLAVSHGSGSSSSVTARAPANKSRKEAASSASRPVFPNGPDQINSIGQGQKVTGKQPRKRRPKKILIHSPAGKPNASGPNAGSSRDMSSPNDNGAPMSSPKTSVIKRAKNSAGPSASAGALTGQDMGASYSAYSARMEVIPSSVDAIVASDPEDTPLDLSSGLSKRMTSDSVVHSPSNGFARASLWSPPEPGTSALSGGVGASGEKNRVPYDATPTLRKLAEEDMLRKDGAKKSGKVRATGETVRSVVLNHGEKPTNIIFKPVQRKGRKKAVVATTLNESLKQNFELDLKRQRQAAKQRKNPSSVVTSSGDVSQSGEPSTSSEPVLDVILKHDLELELKRQQHANRQRKNASSADVSFSGEPGPSSVATSGALSPAQIVETGVKKRAYSRKKDPSAVPRKRAKKVQNNPSTTEASSAPVFPSGTYVADEEVPGPSSASQPAPRNPQLNAAMKKKVAELRQKRARTKGIRTPRAGPTASSSTGSADGGLAGDESSKHARKSIRDPVIAQELKKPFNSGWSRETKIKTTSLKGNISGEVFYYTPRGTKMRQYNDIEGYIEKEGITDLDRSHFSFSAKVDLGDFITVTGERLASHPGKQVNNRRTYNAAEKMRKLRRDKKMQQKIQDDKAQLIHQAALQKRLEKDRKAMEIQQARDRKVFQKEEQKRLRMMEVHQKQIEAHRIREAQLQMKQQKREELERMKVTALMQKAQERERKREQVIAMKTMEIRRKEQQKQEKEEQKVFKEQERLRKLDIREKRLQLEEEMKKPVEDLLLPDAKELPELNEIPGLTLDGKTTGDLLMVHKFCEDYGHCFWLRAGSVPAPGALCEGLRGAPDHDDAESVAAVEKARLVLVKLVRATVEFKPVDGVPQHSYKKVKTELSQKLGDVNVSEDNVSEVLRLLAAERFMDDMEIVNDLEKLPFFALSSSSQISLMAWLVGELLSSAVIIAEINADQDSVLRYRRTKWELEGDIRKLKNVLTEKLRPTHSNNTTSPSGDTAHKRTGVSESSAPGTPRHTSSPAASDTHKIPRVASSLAPGTPTVNSTPGTPRATGSPAPGALASASATPMASTLAAAGSISSETPGVTCSSAPGTPRTARSPAPGTPAGLEESHQEYHSDDERHDHGSEHEGEMDQDMAMKMKDKSREDIERQIKEKAEELAQTRVESRQAAMKVRTHPLGMDRYRRQYWQIPGLRGIYVEGLDSGLDASTCDESDINVAKEGDGESDEEATEQAKSDGKDITKIEDGSKTTGVFEDKIEPAGESKGISTSPISFDAKPSSSAIVVSGRTVEARTSGGDVEKNVMESKSEVKVEIGEKSEGKAAAAAVEEGCLDKDGNTSSGDNSAVMNGTVDRGSKAGQPSAMCAPDVFKSNGGTPAFSGPASTNESAAALGFAMGFAASAQYDSPSAHSNTSAISQDSDAFTAPAKAKSALSPMDLSSASLPATKASSDAALAAPGGALQQSLNGSVQPLRATSSSSDIFGGPNGGGNASALSMLAAAARGGFNLGEDQGGPMAAWLNRTIEHCYNSDQVPSGVRGGSEDRNHDNGSSTPKGVATPAGSTANDRANLGWGAHHGVFLTPSADSFTHNNLAAVGSSSAGYCSFSGGRMGGDGMRSTPTTWGGVYGGGGGSCLPSAQASAADLSEMALTPLLLEKPKKIPLDKQQGWKIISSLPLLKNVIYSASPRGIREKWLAKALQRQTGSKEVVSEDGVGYRSDVFEDKHTTDLTFKEISGDAQDLAVSACWAVEKAVLEKVEGLEERICNDNMHTRFWKPYSGDDYEDKNLVCTLQGASETEQRGEKPHSSSDSSSEDAKTTSSSHSKDTPCNILDEIKSRLLHLEEGLERRYLTLPLYQKPESKLSSSSALTASTQPTVLSDDNAEPGTPSASHDRTPASTPVVDRAGESAGLIAWRHAVATARSSAQLDLCIGQLAGCVAWDRSIMVACCQLCYKDDNEEALMLCEGCDRGYHTYCFKPKWDKVPEDDFFCYQCVSEREGRTFCLRCGLTSGKIVKCRTCPKSLHFDCVDPPFARMPRKWTCGVCLKTSSGGKRKPRRRSAEDDDGEEWAGPKKKTKKEQFKEAAMCKQLLADMDKHRDAWPFRLPVDLTVIPDYACIEQPMDFSTMKTKLNLKLYKSTEDFHTDTVLVFNNCETFNEDDSEIGRAGHTMRRYFDRKWAELFNN